MPRNGTVPRYRDREYHRPSLPSAGNIPYAGGLDPEMLVNFLCHHNILVASSCTLPVLYGGMHLIALNFDFPSPTEQLLWVIAAIHIMAAPSVVVALERIRAYLWHQVSNDTSKVVINRLFKITSLVILLGYILARVYLVFESFAGMRAAPLGVYLTPAWLQMIPHI